MPEALGSSGCTGEAISRYVVGKRAPRQAWRTPPMRTLTRPGSAPSTQCAAVRTRSGAISAPPQNGPRVVSVTSHGACSGGTGVPWKMEAEASRAAAIMLTILA